jgi:hypothetical protein
MHRPLSLKMDVVVVVGVVYVVEVVMAKGCCEVSESSLMSVGQKTSCLGVASPPVCSSIPS